MFPTHWIIFVSKIDYYSAAQMNYVVNIEDKLNWLNLITADSNQLMVIIDSKWNTGALSICLENIKENGKEDGWSQTSLSMTFIWNCYNSSIARASSIQSLEKGSLERTSELILLPACRKRYHSGRPCLPLIR